MIEKEYFTFLTRLYHFNLNFNIEHLYCFSYPDKKCLQDLKKKIRLLNNLKKIYILESSKLMSGYSGFLETKKVLSQILDKNIDIIPIPYLYDNAGMINTYTESLSVIDYFSEHKISKIAVYSPYFHLPRSFITLVSNILKKKENIKVYPVSGIMTDFNKTLITHCQGIVRENADKLLEIEFERIKKYTEKGDLLELKFINQFITNY